MEGRLVFLFYFLFLINFIYWVIFGLVIGPEIIGFVTIIIYISI